MCHPVCLLLVLVAVGVDQSQAFFNPIVQKGEAPSVQYFNGNYFLVQTTDGPGIKVIRSKRLENLGTGQVTTVWNATSGTDSCCTIVAPELVYWKAEKTWYIYFAARTISRFPRTFILEGKKGAAPDGDYTFRGKMKFQSDHWSVDATVIRISGKSYLVWAGDIENNNTERIYIASMGGPTSITSDHHLLSKPKYEWEAIVNSGPAPLQKDGRIYIAYTAFGLHDVSLGLLTYKGGDPLDSESWVKSSVPVFTGDHGFTPYTTHNCFTVSPDGQETWNVYQAAKQSGTGVHLSIRAQRLDWNADGSPNFGKPVRDDVNVKPPSGE